MAESVTDWLHESRFTVVSVDAAARRIRLKGSAGVCTDVSCSGEAEVVADDVEGSLDVLCAGDIVRIESSAGAGARIRVVRRVWDEFSSPEF